MGGGGGELGWHVRKFMRVEQLKHILQWRGEVMFATEKVNDGRQLVMNN